MRQGTPGFVGERLTQARRTAVRPAAWLAEQVGVNKRTISAYEAGTITPNPLTVGRFAELLGVDEQFFFSTPSAIPRSTIFYRSMSSATLAARSVAEIRLSWLTEIVDYLETYVEMPAPNFPEFDLSSNWNLLTADEIEALADQARDFWRLPRGPISNVVRVLEANGFIVARSMLGAATLDGLSAFVNQRPYLVVGTDKGSAVRWRFDASHELGHALMHRSVEREILNKGAEHKALEEQAHRFAAAFLLPIDSFADDLITPTLDGLRALKPKWKVSIGMMIRRLRDAHIIGEEAYRGLMINYTRRGWRTLEPFDETTDYERPQLLSAALEALIGGGFTRDEIIAALPLPITATEELTNLPNGWFVDDDPAPPIRLKLV